jgi:microcystin-dependent protein
VCQGQVLPIIQNQPLFALLGTRYGGDGKRNFALPNLQGAVPLAQGTWCIALQGIFPARD